MNLTRKHGILRGDIRINIPGKHVTFNPTPSNIKVIKISVQMNM